MAFSPENEFVRLCLEAEEIDRKTTDVRATEQAMIQILNLVKSHPKKRDVFVKLFTEVIEGRIQAPDYLIPFCMRELRFPEIKERALQNVNNLEQYPRMMNYISDIIHAFEDDVWINADLWPYYSKELNTRE